MRGKLISNKVSWFASFNLFIPGVFLLDKSFHWKFLYWRKTRSSFFSRWFLTTIQWAFFNATMLCKPQRGLHEAFQKFCYIRAGDEVVKEITFPYISHVLDLIFLSYCSFSDQTILEYSTEKVQHPKRQKHVLLVVVVIYMFLVKYFFFAIFTE